MARTVLPQSTAMRSTFSRSNKQRSTKEPTTTAQSGKVQSGKALGVATRRGSQASLLLSTTAQLRSSEQGTQQDAQRRARRRRQAVRQLRQVEATIARVRLPAFANLRLRLPTGLGVSNWQASKVGSALLLAGVVALLIWVHNDIQWFVYRENVTFTGVTYVSADDLYQQSDLDSWNIFWLSPGAVRERLVALPTVADAQVVLQLPNQVMIEIQEEQPVALWVTQEGNYWLLPDGTALPEPEQGKSHLLQIIDPQRDAKAWVEPASTKIDSGVLQSALTLTNYLPEVNQIYFNQDLGLNFHLPGSSTWVYWGDGLNMDKKYTNIAALQRHLRIAGTQPNIIDIRFEKPVLK